jgi:hypothetical protein
LSFTGKRLAEKFANCLGPTTNITPMYMGMGYTAQSKPMWGYSAAEALRIEKEVGVRANRIPPLTQMRGYALIRQHPPHLGL